MEELPRVNSQLIEAFKNIPVHLLGENFWPGINVTPSMWIGIDLDHIKDHSKDIREVVDSGYENVMKKKISPRYKLALPPRKDLKDGFDELRHLLMLEDIFLVFEKLTGLKPDQIVYQIEHSDEADWKGVDLIYVNYGRGFWAYLSMIHELVHIVLRQKKWDQDPALKRFFSEYPEVNVPSRGNGYKVEQMFAHLVQKDCANILDEKFGGNKYSKEWGEDKFEKIVEKEFNKGELERIGKLIITMWEMKGETEDIISFAKRVADVKAHM